MPTNIENKCIVVTGAGRGIGAEIARGLAADGARLTVADLSGEAAEKVAAEIRSAGGTAIGVAVDVRQRESVRAMIDRTVQEHGRLDVIFNNAGIAQTKPFLDITEDDWHFVMDVNALGVMIGMQEAIRRMQAQGGGGKIVNTASIAGKQGYEPLAHYSASKFAVVALTQAAARAFGKDRINVNAICPGVVATDMWKVIDGGFQDARPDVAGERGLRHLRRHRRARPALHSAGPRRRRPLPGVRRQRLHDRPVPAGGRRHGLRLSSMRLAERPDIPGAPPPSSARLVSRRPA